MTHTWWISFTVSSPYVGASVLAPPQRPPATFEDANARCLLPHSSQCRFGAQQIIEVSGHTGEPKCMKTLRVSPRDLTSSMVSRTTCPSSGMPS